MIGDLTSNHSGDAHEWFQAALGNPGAPRGVLLLHATTANTEYVSWLGVPEPAEVQLVVGGAARAGSSTATTRSSPSWLKPPFSLDGWRIDVANMTGRLGDDDLNAEVRQLIRRTMERDQPRHDAARRVDERRGERPPGRRLARRDDLRRLHPAAVGLAAASRRLPYLDADGESTTRRGSSGSRSAASRDYTGARRSSRRTARSPPASRGACGWAHMQPLDTHDTARFRTHGARRARSRSRSGSSMTLPGHPGRVRRRRVRTDRRRRRGLAHADPVGRGGASRRRRLSRSIAG